MNTALLVAALLPLPLLGGGATLAFTQPEPLCAAPLSTRTSHVATSTAGVAEVDGALGASIDLPCASVPSAAAQPQPDVSSVAADEATPSPGASPSAEPGAPATEGDPAAQPAPTPAPGKSTNAPGEALPGSLSAAAAVTAEVSGTAGSTAGARRAATQERVRRTLTTTGATARDTAVAGAARAGRAACDDALRTSGALTVDTRATIRGGTVSTTASVAATGRAGSSDRTLFRACPAGTSHQDQDQD